ncbi:MAG: dTMP kinase [Pseudomonadales bacterium]|nr:dTMP kinase [Pseudomonadales bacterium]
MSSAARFITLEGCEGVGKTTNANLIESILLEAKLPFIRTREPGGTPLAESLRELLIVKRSEKIHPLCEVLMVFAARAQHVNEVIRPALESGIWVLCDRFTDASFAYQGGGRGVEDVTIEQLENIVHSDLQPDLTLYLDMPVDMAMSRIQARELDRFEEEQQTFFEKVRSAYLRRAEVHARFHTIDAAQNLENVQSDIRDCLLDFIQSAVSE